MDKYLIGCRNETSILYSYKYVVQHPNGTEDTLIYVKFVEKIYSHIDMAGNHLLKYSGIVRHQKKKGTVDKTYQFYEKY